MRELNVMEISEVSGAGFWDAVNGAITLGATGFAAGGAYGGIHGGDNGGLLGIGAFGQLVGVIVGPVIGVIGGGALGAVLGWNDLASVTALSTQWVNNFVNGTFK